MRNRALFVVAITHALACSSAHMAASPCADISGNWQVSLTRNGGDCADPKLDGGDASIAIRRATDGSWQIVLPGAAGGCPGTLNSACHFQASCNFTDASGTTLVSDDIDWEFDGASLRGSEIARAMPPEVPVACSANYTETGKRL